MTELAILFGVLGAALFAAIVCWPLLGAGLFLLANPLIVGIARGQLGTVLRPNEVLLLFILMALGLRVLLLALGGRYRPPPSMAWMWRRSALSRRDRCCRSCCRRCAISAEPGRYALCHRAAEVLCAVPDVPRRGRGRGRRGDLPAGVVRCRRTGCRGRDPASGTGVRRRRIPAGLLRCALRGPSGRDDHAGDLDHRVCLRPRRPHDRQPDRSGARHDAHHDARALGAGRRGDTVRLWLHGGRHDLDLYRAHRRAACLRPAHPQPAPAGAGRRGGRRGRRACLLAGDREPARRLRPELGHASSWEGREANLERFFLPELLSDDKWLFGVRAAPCVPAPEAWREMVYIQSGYVWLIWIGGIPFLLAFLGFAVFALRRLARIARARADAVGCAAAAGFCWVASMVVMMLFDPHLRSAAGLTCSTPCWRSAGAVPGRAAGAHASAGYGPPIRLAGGAGRIRMRTLSMPTRRDDAPPPRESGSPVPEGISILGVLRAVHGASA